MSSSKKVFVISPPATGHVNPMCGIINELCKEKNVKVIFFNDEEYRELIEKTGAEFRKYAFPTVTLLPKKPITDRSNPVGSFMSILISFSEKLLPQLIDEVEKERPDLILYDGVFLPAKYLIKVIQVRYEKKKSDFAPPKTAMFIPNFPADERMMKSARENLKIDMATVFSVMGAFKKQIGFSWNYGISTYNPITVFTEFNPNLNIVGVVPELQPHLDEFDSSFKFVGSCVSEEARSVEIKNDDELKSLLDEFAVKSDARLVYMSLGTILNINTFIFERFIEAIRDYDQNPSHKFKLAQLRVVVAMGDKNLAGFREKISKGELVLPANMLIRDRVPQLEILKRAHVFVTHCGMNSTSETIKYSVPPVCIPLEADQPIVAKRICDELNLGIRLDPLNLRKEDIADAIDTMLSDEKYANNVREMSKISAQYNGPLEGAKIVINYLSQ